MDFFSEDRRLAIRDGLVKGFNDICEKPTISGPSSLIYILRYKNDLFFSYGIMYIRCADDVTESRPQLATILVIRREYHKIYNLFIAGHENSSEVCILQKFKIVFTYQPVIES